MWLIVCHDVVKFLNWDVISDVFSQLWVGRLHGPTLTKAKNIQKKDIKTKLDILFLFFPASKSHSLTIRPHLTSVLKEAACWRCGIMRLDFFLNKSKTYIQLCFYVLWPFLAFFRVINGVSLHKTGWLKNAISIQEFHNVMAHYKPH